VLKNPELKAIYDILRSERNAAWRLRRKVAKSGGPESCSILSYTAENMIGSSAKDMIHEACSFREKTSGLLLPKLLVAFC
jgi:hypothetical protein